MKTTKKSKCKSLTNAGPRKAGLALLMAAAIAGCSTMEPPRNDLSQARTFIDAAKQDEADRYAAVTLNRAKDRLDLAQTAMDKEDYLRAKYLAEEAMVEAKLASSQAQTEKMKNALNEVNQSLESMNKEIESEY